MSAEIVAADGRRYMLSVDLVLPHVIRNGVDLGVATQTEEALWAEILRLRAELDSAQ
jgi:hypothetical protein